MTTLVLNTTYSHTDTTTFRAWGLEFSTALSTVGMIQTSDTGQINWTTVAYTGTTNTRQGYEVWKTPDSTLYYKFEYGTAATGATLPGIWVTIGTGSNGSGTITGQTNTAIATIHAQAAPTSTTTQYYSYFAAGNGYLNLVWKAASTSGSVYHGAILISGTTVDNTGAVTNIGFGAYRANTTTFGFQTVRTAAIAITMPEMVGGGGGTTLPSFSIVPNGPLSSADNNGANQAYPWWMNVKSILPFKWACAVSFNEVTIGTRFQSTLIGTTPHTYLAIPTTSNSGIQTKPTNYISANSTGDANFTIAMLFE